MMGTNLSSSCQLVRRKHVRCHAEQFATARWVFATFSAIAVALAGSVAALVYYASSRAPGTPSAFGILMAKVVARASSLLRALAQTSGA